ncbi:putative protein phosphatase 2C 24 [Camellia lanceoleosa]|uniref:Uncharacterized protein n=1 Tax=Camellia lanceoleosa TaxID=1840588 RepID=A0ACC0HWX6_9ERIC|nr:putative protein phosphatase 2C 24 [Camellia lanceoleosa]
MKCRDQLHELVKEEIEKKDSSTEEWKIAMERSFNRMDNKRIINDSRADVDSNSSDFWVMVATLKVYNHHFGEDDG